MNLYVYNPNVRNPTCYKSNANAMKKKEGIASLNL